MLFNSLNSKDSTQALHTQKLPCAIHSPFIRGSLSAGLSSVLVEPEKANSRAVQLAPLRLQGGREETYGRLVPCPGSCWGGKYFPLQQEPGHEGNRKPTDSSSARLVLFP